MFVLDVTAFAPSKNLGDYCFFPVEEEGKVPAPDIAAVPIIAAVTAAANVEASDAVFLAAAALVHSVFGEANEGGGEIYVSPWDYSSLSVFF